MKMFLAPVLVGQHLLDEAGIECFGWGHCGSRTCVGGGGGGEVALGLRGEWMNVFLFGGRLNVMGKPRVKQT